MEFGEDPPPAVFEELSSVLSKQSSTRSATKRRRRSAQGLGRFQALTDEISKHNRMLAALLRIFNINYNEFEEEIPVCRHLLAIISDF
jgi:hypothetical protein